jgi:hypothetical protein
MTHNLRFGRSLRFFRKGRVLRNDAASASRHHGHFAMLLTRGPYDDLHVLAERREEVHEAFDGKGAGTVAHQCGNVGLLDAENLSRFRLLEAAALDEAVDLQGKFRFQQLPLRMRQAKVGENISAAFLCARCS